MKIQAKLLQEITKANRTTVEILLIERIKKALENCGFEKIDFILENPKEEFYGDYATNVALLLAKQSKRNPLEIAREIVEKIGEVNFLEEITVAAPGFVNFKIKADFFLQELQKILERQTDYGKLEKNNKQVMVEFGQPNTHKAFTVGHIKGTISGLSVARLLENLGYQVIKTNYYGDIGMHTAKCTWGVMQRGLPKDFDNWGVHQKMDFIAESYVFASDNFTENEEAIRQINQDIYQGVKNEATVLYEKIKIWSLEHQRTIFAELGVVYDKQYSETAVFEQAKEIVTNNKGKLFVESQGAIIYEGGQAGLNTWVVETSEGHPTYLAKDLALAFQKLADYPQLDFNLTMTGVEQIDYFKAVIKILETLDDKFQGKYFHLAFGWLLMNGKKTSSRSGKNIKGTDLLNESLVVAKTKIAELKNYEESQKEKIAKVVSLAGLKFLILSHEFNKDINYDPQKFVNFEGYSGPYILYAYVRARAILEKSSNLEDQSFGSLETQSFNDAEEKLLKWLVRYSQTAQRAGREVAPHLICNYLYELAQRFNAFYACCPVLEATNQEKQLRLALTAGTAQVLQNGLALLGIDTIEAM